MNFISLKLSRSGPVATVALNRPDVRNAFDEVLIAELTQAFQSLAADGTVRAAILTGSGDIFCSGADVNWLKRSAHFTESQNKDDALRMSLMFRAIDECPKPVIGRINGHSFGGGMGLIACCDVAVAVETARFAFSEVKLGIVPGVISAYVLPKIGAAAARRYFLTGETFEAKEARRLGLVHDIVSADGLDAAVSSIAGALLKNGPRAVATAKELIPHVLSTSRPEAIEYTASLIARVRVSEEGQEGLGAFLEKRKPTWIP
ncbi:MAG: enoyl-CoA hydratase/isomerase family protein [Planctomycetes bacterium]|nr:enoyl-CoA hydratase/isomerase family protein [Planctomycetota bacterium]